MGVWDGAPAGPGAEPLVGLDPGSEAVLCSATTCPKFWSMGAPGPPIAGSATSSDDRIMQCLARC